MPYPLWPMPKARPELRHRGEAWEVPRLRGRDSIPLRACHVGHQLGAALARPADDLTVAVSLGRAAPQAPALASSATAPGRRQTAGRRDAELFSRPAALPRPDRALQPRLCIGIGQPLDLEPPGSSRNGPVSHTGIEPRCPGRLGAQGAQGGYRLWRVD